MRTLPGSSFRPRADAGASRDVFEKCRQFTRPKDLQTAGLYMYFETFGDRAGCGPGEVRIGDRKILMFGSNDYLDLITHPKVVEAAGEALRRYGTGCSGSRLLNGTLDLHVEVEARLAALARKEAALIFGTGFQCNYSALSALTEKGEALICDHNLHASCVEGALRSAARNVRFRHNDMEHLERCLRTCAGEPALIVSEGVFSMEGDLANLPEIMPLAKKYGARLMVDDAHGIGVMGEHGRGTAEHFGLIDDVDMIMTTFSKSFAALGGYVAGDSKVIQYIKHHARALIFSASITPAALGAASQALEIIQKEPWRRKRLWEITQTMNRELTKMGFHTGNTQTPIIPVFIHDIEKTFMLWHYLREYGIFANPVIAPAVPPESSLIRTSYTATHTDEDLDFILKGFYQGGKTLGII